MKKQQNVVIYQAKNGAIALRAGALSETLWATQAQMAAIFDVNPQAITKHLKNIYAQSELLKKATCSKMEQVQKEAGRLVKRSVEIYNLDAIISVGYRISSKAGTRFRQWATKTLHQHILAGYTINRSRIEQDYQKFLQAVEAIQKLSLSHVGIDMGSAIELIKIFANTWFSLDAYDKAQLPSSGNTKRKVQITFVEFENALRDLKSELVKKGEATDLFARERTKGELKGIISGIFQSFGGRELYASVEGKAAHLLYFFLKNHPFVDGNKRSGAFAFVWFLRRTGLLNLAHLTPAALTALTLLVAESDPKEKERVVGLILLLLR